MPADLAEPCELLTWDTEFFGFPVARLREPKLDAADIPPIEAWCRAHTISLLYLLCDSSDARGSRAAETMGAHLVDVRITLGRSVSPSATHRDAAVRPATAADISRLQDIAMSSHKDTRFYLDPDFPPALADALYRRWIKASCEGFDDIVLVTDRAATAAAYITCRADRKNNTGSIGLFAVSPEARGQGVGTNLITAAFHWFASVGVDRVTVVTQGRNVAAQRLYGRAGFLLENAQLYYHKWCRSWRSD